MAKALGKKKIGKVMDEFSKGVLKTSAGKPVIDPTQAKAIALSEARAAGANIPLAPEKAKRRVKAMGY